MTGIYKHLLAYVDIESGELGAVIEDMIERAFKDGYRHGASRKTYEPDTPANAYHDWRGWGPGATMPGGSAYRLHVENMEAMKAIAADMDARGRGVQVRGPFTSVHMTHCRVGPNACIECANDVLDAIE